MGRLDQLVHTYGLKLTLLQIMEKRDMKDDDEAMAGHHTTNTGTNDVRKPWGQRFLRQKPIDMGFETVIVRDPGRDPLIGVLLRAA